MAENFPVNRINIERQRAESFMARPESVNRFGIPANRPPAVGPAAGSGNPTFAEVFGRVQTQKDDLVISKHAEMRLRTRNIQITDQEKQRISQALDKAKEKGVKDPLVMMDNLALVANTKSRTVITAVCSSELKQNIFTNIDGAVFA